MKILFSPPSLDDLIRLLKAWRFWSVGALIGGLLGAGLFYIAPPPYRAHAIVLVDFHLEQAWPQNTDREQFYYLERESRKLEEIAHSDKVIETVAEKNLNVSQTELHNGMLVLSQPESGGWNFYVDDKSPRRAASVATAWANAFVDQVHAQVQPRGGLNSYIEASVSRIAGVPVQRSVSISLYIFVGAVAFLMIASIVFLFFSQPK